MSSIPKYEFNAKGPDRFDFEINRIEDKQALKMLGPKPRRDSFYVIFLIEGGSGIYTIDFEQHNISKNMIFCIVPGQIHYWALTSAISGWVILFTEDFLTTNLAYNTTRFPEDFTIFNWDTRSGFSITDIQWEQFQILPQIMMIEYSKHSDLFCRKLAIQSTLLLLLINVQRLHLGSTKVDSTAREHLVREFMLQVNKEFQHIHSVHHYATKLGVTAGHLSDTVSEVLGEPPQKIIHKRIVLEAKRLLIHTNLPASTICEMLGFSDASYFGRFFKREVGETTKVYRQNFR